MKKIKAFALFSVFAILISLTSCYFGECSVSFVHAGGTDERSVLSGMPISFEPDTKDGYIFSGWYSDSEYTRPVDISGGVTKDTTLYAKYEVDYEAFSRNISLISGAFVSIRCTSYSYVGTKPQAVSAASGSGAVLKSQGGYYYVITNHHVISGELALLREYKVSDVYGNEYEAELIASDSAVDLALLRFKAGTEKLKCIEIDTSMPDYEEAVAAIGNPLGKHNTLTFGKIKNFKEVDIVSAGSDTVNVDFKVLWHTAYMESGSSGGALINPQMKLIGINFATGADADGNFAYGFTIPSEKVGEFIGKAGLG